MKAKKAALYLAVFTVLAALFQACGKGGASSPVPAGPPAPTSTPTNLGGFTSTPSPTRTFTSTPTIPGGATATPSSPTATYTSTFTYTFTLSPTRTRTPTPTPTFCATGTFTPTVVTTNHIMGTVNYTGPGTVSASNPLAVFITDNFSSSNYEALRWVTSNGGSYTAYGMPNGNYYATFWYNAAGDGMANDRPHAGDRGKIYNVSSCNLAQATPVAVNNGMTDVSPALDGTNVVYGLAGTVTYTGSLGPAGAQYCKPIAVAIYSDSGYTNQLDIRGVFTNGGRYDCLNISTTTSLCSTTNVYLRAWLVMATVSGVTPQTGDPYFDFGLRSTSTLANQNISFGDALIW